MRVEVWIEGLKDGLCKKKKKSASGGKVLASCRRYASYGSYAASLGETLRSNLHKSP